MEASQPRAASAAVIRLLTTMSCIDPTLAQAIANGTYVVDPAAVADAIVRRHSDLADARRLSEVLVAGQRDERSSGIAQGNSGAGADVA